MARLSGIHELCFFDCLDFIAQLRGLLKLEVAHAQTSVFLRRA